MKKLIVCILMICAGTCLHAQTVFKTPSGAKYHTADCRMIKNVSQEISLSDAIAMGLTPCKICHRDAASYGSGSSASHKATGEGLSVQCKGMTKKGLRCKHQTRNANGYCAQHQP